MTTATLVNGFTYADISVLNVVPPSGTTAGGTAVTISGGGFNQYAIVYFGDQLATDITYVSSTEISCITPANIEGACTVTVTQQTTSSALVDGYEYVASLNVGSVLPNNGTTDGGLSLIHI